MSTSDARMPSRVGLVPVATGTVIFASAETHSAVRRAPATSRGAPLALSLATAGRRAALSCGECGCEACGPRGSRRSLARGTALQSGGWTQQGALAVFRRDSRLADPLFVDNQVDVLCPTTKQRDPPRLLLHLLQVVSSLVASTEKDSVAKILIRRSVLASHLATRSLRDATTSARHSRGTE
jgi:hypothetical protein